MGKQTSRRGSMQFWPRKRSTRTFPRVNWLGLNGKKEGVGFLGFIGYKVGMKSAFVKDNTPNSMTKGKRIAIPVTVIECPSIKILSIRLYNKGKVVGEVLNEADKEVKKNVKLPKEYKTKEMLDKYEKDMEFEDLRVIVYSQVKKTGIKRKPDFAEVGLSGSKEEKLSFVKENLSKEFSVLEFFKEGVVDVRAITIGKGTQGPVKRFGIKLRFHKTEKGQRKVGSIGPWHPARVSYRVPMAGQMGYFNRIVYNNKIVFAGKVSEKDINFSSGFKKYGIVKNDYLIVAGSLQGPSKRQMLITLPLRPTKKQVKKSYEFVELR